jgi:uncharacterized protein (DUF433 family)
LVNPAGACYTDDMAEAHPRPEELEHWITSDESVRFGKPIVRGTRVTVEEVVGAVASGLTLAEVGEEFDVDPQAVQAALRYAAQAASNERRWAQ